MDHQEFKQLDIAAAQDGGGNLYGRYERNHVRDFMDGNGVLFYVLSAVRRYEILPDGIRLEVEARPFRNRHFWTHETMMNCLSEEKELPAETACVRVEFFSRRVFRVRMNRGARPLPGPELSGMPTRMLTGEPRPAGFSVSEQEGDILLKTPELTVRVRREPFLLSACTPDGKLIYSQKGYETWISDSFRTAYAVRDDRAAFYETLALYPGEKIFGLGERFDGVERTGRTVDFWNKDAIGTTSRRSYINVPFYFSTAGYGLFLNEYGRTQWEVGTRDSGAVTIGADGQALDYFVMGAGTPAEILREYAELTGYAAMPPVWSFGLWMSRNSYESWEVVDGVIADMNERGIPFDVIHLDTAWFAEDWNCDLRFSPQRFPDPAAKMAALRQQGIRISLWQYNFLPNRPNPNLDTAVREGYLAADAEGRPYRYPDYVQGSWIDDAVIDFSNPEAARWYGDMIAGLVRMGAAAIKTDFGEGIPADAVYHGIEGKYFHNYYALVYNHVIFRALRRADPQTLVWARSGTAGSQRYPIHWGGDCQCTWAGLAGTLRGMLSAGLSGIAFFSHDIGGFIGRPSPELYIRWAQLGLFSSHSRCHGAGNSNSREPSSFGPQAAAVFQKYALLRYRLLPYIVAQAEASVREGLPLVRHLVLSFPEDPQVRCIEDQYMLGDSLLVAPVLRPAVECPCRAVYLPLHPAGWVDFHTLLPQRCGWITVPSDIEILPLYVRGDAVLPYAAPRLRTHNTIGEIERLQVFPSFDGRFIYECGGVRFALETANGEVVRLSHSTERAPRIEWAGETPVRE